MSEMTPQEQIDFVLGPQISITNSWLDQTLVAEGRKHLDAFPATPPTDDNGLNSFILHHYYDLAQSGYILYRRTSDPADLQRARKVADSWWKHPTWIGEGALRPWPDNVAPSPRHAGVGGLILRALDGRPEMWDWIVTYILAQMDIWCNWRINNDQLWYGPREVAFTMQYAAWVAKALLDSFPDAAQVKARLIADLENLTINYTGRLQYPDGSWRDSSEWVDNVRAMLSANAPVNVTQLKVIALDFPIAAGQKVAFEKGGVTKTTKPQSAGSIVIDIEPLTVARAVNDVLYVDDGTTMSGTMQPFIVGLLICALVDIHQVVSGTAKESVKNQILKACRHLYSDGPYARDLVEQRSGKRVRGFHYFFHGGTDLNPTKYAKGSMVHPWTDFEGWWLSSARQAISTILPAFGYAFKISGDQYYKDAASEMYDSAYGGGDGYRAFIANNTSKNYNQHARRVGSLAAWLGSAVIEPPLPPIDPPPPPIDPPELPPQPVPTPSVVLTSPANGAILAGKITVTATITDAIEIYLIIDDLVRGMLTGTPYSIELDTTKLSEGEHSLFVRAWNAAGKSGDSARVNITVRNTVVEPPPPPVDPPPVEPPVVVPPTPPKPCSISAFPSTLNIPRNGTGIIAVSLNDLTGPTEVRVTGFDGQVGVTPLVWSAGPTSTMKQFQVRVKNKKLSKVITFGSPCGSVKVTVNVV